jgi:hypothetical protein
MKIAITHAYLSQPSWVDVIDTRLIEDFELRDILETVATRVSNRELDLPFEVMQGPIFDASVADQFPVIIDGMLTITED